MTTTKEHTMTGADPMRTAIVDDEREAILAELTYCRQVQDWADGTRSGWQWTDALQAILDADTRDEASVRMVAAQEVARDLAIKIGRRLIDVDVLAERLAEVTDDGDVLAEIESATTIAALVELARRHGLEVDDANRGHRDGWTLSADEATVYAAIRGWSDDPDSVLIDALTGEVL